MPKSLRSILGTSHRVKKPPRQPTARRADNSESSPRKTKPKRQIDDELFQEKLTDLGAIKLMEEDLTLRDVVQAMRYIRQKMFTRVPETGFKSTRSVEILNYRLTMPAIITVGHINAVLSSPSLVEREMAELIRKGILRKVRVERRGNAGEALIELSDLFEMMNKTRLGDDAKAGFIEFLKANPTSQTMSRQALPPAHFDELVRAGFLTSISTRATPATTLHVRPEDRTTLTSIKHVSQFASGTVSAVGGQNIIHMAGGGGGGRGFTLSQGSDEEADFRIAVPGHGRYLKLAEAAVDWIREMLAKTKWGEAPEEWLRERFEGGGLYGTRWKEFWGVEWTWAIGQAIGLGVVELFDTGSVGKGVRALAL